MDMKEIKRLLDEAFEREEKERAKNKTQKS